MNTINISDEVSSRIENILIVGDSITEGYNSDPGLDWVTLLGIRMKQDWDQISIKNAGLAGYTSSQVLNEELIPNISYATQICIVQCGTNDTRIDLRIDNDETKQNLKKIIRLIKSVNAVPVLLTLTPIEKQVNVTFPDAYNDVSISRVQQINAIIRALCSKEKIICADVAKAFKKGSNLISEDHLHPNNRGHRLISNIVYTELMRSSRSNYGLS